MARSSTARVHGGRGAGWWGRRSLLSLVVVGFIAGVAVVGTRRDGSSETAPGSSPSTGSVVDASSATSASSLPSSTTTTTTLAPYSGWVDPSSSGQPYPKSSVEGLITFRGNPTRSWYGTGPMPRAPKVLWSFPPGSGGMCAESNGGEEGVQTWCGTGWNGQPSVWQRDGRTWVAFGAYDDAVHFLDAATGARILPDLVTGDLAKGTVTVDPDGYPLLYHGSRDNNLRVIALDRAEPTTLWKLNAYDVSPVLWNDDWDGSPLVIGDYLFEGGENSQIHIVKLNRGYGPDGKVTVRPELVFHAPGWDQDLLTAIGDKMVSIENSVNITGNTLWFANSGGLVQGWDISGLRQGQAPTRIFRFWTGDDTDASIVSDQDGFLYVASEWKRHTERGRQIGQIMKLDPRHPDNPVVWSINDQGAGKFGVWGTPALYQDMLYVPTNGGRLLGIDRMTGTIRWEKRLPSPTWQSPVPIDGVLIEGDCSGVLHAYDIHDTHIDPPQLWTVQLQGCIESTPAVWQGRIYVGARGGRFYAIGDKQN